MDQETIGRIGRWAGPILGGGIGLLGGIIGSYCSIKNTKGPRERAFMVRATIICWIGISAFILGMWFLPTPYRFGLIPIYVIALLLAIRTCNKRQALIRAEEAKPPPIAASIE